MRYPKLSSKEVTLFVLDIGEDCFDAIEISLPKARPPRIQKRRLWQFPSSNHRKPQIPDGILWKVGDSKLNLAKEDRINQTRMFARELKNFIFKNFKKDFESRKRSPGFCLIGLEDIFAKTIISKASLIRESFEKPIDHWELENAVHKIQRRLYEKERSKIAWRIGVKETEIKIADAGIRQILVNDHRVLNPLGFSGRTLGFIVFNTYLEKFFFNLLKEEVFEGFNFEQIFIIERNAALAEMLAKVLQRNIVFIHLGAQKTRIGVVRSPYYEGVQSFLWGETVLQREIAEFFQVDSNIAALISKRYQAKELSPRVMRAIKGVLEPVLRFFVEAVELALKNFLSDLPLPSEFVLLGPGADWPDISLSLRKHDWQGFSAKTSKKPGHKGLFSKPKVSLFDISEVLASETKGFRGGNRAKKMSIAEQSGGQPGSGVGKSNIFLTALISQLLARISPGSVESLGREDEVNRILNRVIRWF